MSYILDALRRADAERERGIVPGLHSNTTTADPEPAARDHRPLLYAAAAAGALAVAVIAVLAFGPWRAAPGAAPPDVVGERGPAPTDGPGTRVATTPPQPPVRSLDPGTNAPAEVSPPPDRPAPPPRREDVPRPGVAPHSVDQPAPVLAAQANASALAARAAKGRVGVVVPVAAAKPVARSREAAAAPASAGADDGVEHYGPPVSTPPAQAAAPAVPAIRRFEDLPPTLRSTMPRFTVGGAIYSDTPSARMLILNGQVYHEGDHPTPDTLLEQIKLKSAVMNYRGTRYEIAF